MINPEEIIKKAERKFYEVLRSWLRGELFMPIEFPVGSLSNDLTERRQQIEALRQRSKEGCGSGYALEWDTISTQTLGKQTYPRRVLIAELEDYLTLIHKQMVFKSFVADVLKIRQRFPALESWIHKSPHSVIAYHGQWEDLLSVCDYFVQHPRPNLYARELPISVHTKFIETNTMILRELFEYLLPPETIRQDAKEFNLRYGLRDKPQSIRLRLLEEQLDWQYGIRVDDLILPVEQVAHLLTYHIRPKRVVIVENLINFLTLPRLPNSIGIFGGGFAVHLLRDVLWLLESDIIYWGDIDAHGFEILSDLRGIFPHTRSIMMDQTTLDTYSHYVVRGTPTRTDQFPQLTSEEKQVAQQVLERGLRLEQEHIPHEYAISQLKRWIMG